MDLLSLLILTILILSLLQSHKSNFYAGCVVAFFTVTYDVFSTHVPGSAYYVLAAIFDLIVIKSISLIIDQTPLTLELQRISMASALFNAVGWAAYMLYLSPIGYNYAFIVLYSYTVIVLLYRGGIYDGGDIGVDRLRSGFFANTVKRGNYHRAHKD